MFTFLLQDYFKHSSRIAALVGVSGVPLAWVGGSVGPAAERLVSCCSEKAWRKDWPLCFQVKNEKKLHLPCDFIGCLRIFLLFHLGLKVKSERNTQVFQTQQRH